MPRSDVITVAELLGRNPGATPHVPVGPRNLPRPVRREPWLTRTNKTSAAITFGSVLAVGTTLAVGSTLLPHTRQAVETVPPTTTGPVADSSSVTPPETVPEHADPAPVGLADPSGTSTFTGPRAPAAQGPALSDRSGAPRVPAHGSAHSRDSAGSGSSTGVSGRGSARVPSQGRHAASAPRGPHLDSRGNPAPAAGPSPSGRHRNSGQTLGHDAPGPSNSGPSNSEPSNSGPSDSGRSHSDHSGSGRSHSDHSGSGSHSDRSGSDGSGGGLLGGVLNGLSIGPL